jgi:hypothetical protein
VWKETAEALTRQHLVSRGGRRESVKGKKKNYFEMKTDEIKKRENTIKKNPRVAGRVHRGLGVTARALH